MRSGILIDAETTGLDPRQGDRIVEICAIKFRNHKLTDEVFCTLVYPDREIPEWATGVHGISDKDVERAPSFGNIAGKLRAFIGRERIIAHNAQFYLIFLNAEFARLDMPRFSRRRFIDTLALARSCFPGQWNSLLALCERFGIDTSGRTSRDAERDLRSLWMVYQELLKSSRSPLH
jgi:DNA polymerase-3 subunit epsilon